MFIIAAGVLGAILGSFLNALLFRYNTGRSVAAGRSRCMSCGHTLAPLDLVPVLSYAVLLGKCRYCQSHISVQYPLVEALSALLAVALYVRNPEPLHFFLSLFVWMVLLFVLVYDLRHKIIPWSAMGLAILGAGALLVLDREFTSEALTAGVALAAPLLLLSAVSRGTWMGWADGVLEFGLGLLLGLSAGASALVMAFWIGAVVGITLLILPRGYTMKSEVPFAPFLILGAALSYFLHVDFLQTLPALFF
ncbi:prepilin peptidase [Candidatus Kaiserbacteria bacterium]|nr:prepilin peptidase [Candidatus Kaiserbacteria bacterium]